MAFEIRTRITEMLGIEYPIIQGGLQWLSRAELAAAVSEAGGFGLITAATFPSPEELRKEIRKARQLTTKPFGVNVSMPQQTPIARPIDGYFEVVMEEKIPAVETSGRNPEPYVERLKKAGVRIFHKVAAVRYAKKAQSIGVDAVIIVGMECGGRPGMDEVSSLVLIPRAAQELSLPIIAGGGIADGRGFLAALALGAEGVLMGTRFMASRECPLHPNFHARMIAAQETDTALIMKSYGNPARVLRNRAAEKVLELESRRAPLAEIVPLMGGVSGRNAYQTGDVDATAMGCGQAVGLIREIKSAAEIIREVTDQAGEIAGRLGSIFREMKNTSRG